MKPKKKTEPQKSGLQKLSKFDDRLDDLLKLETITPGDIKDLTKEERQKLYSVLTEKFNDSKDVKRDKVTKQIERIAHTDFKNQVWEENHLKITGAISNLMAKNGVMPSRTQIAKETELSRTTVNNHLKEYSSHPLFLEQAEQFRFMSSRVLAKVFDYAINNGDVKAAKLFLTAIGGTEGNTTIKNQNNYIQINGMVINQETVKLLTHEQLSNIESILKAALPPLKKSVN
jgi:hypothetical protein